MVHLVVAEPLPDGEEEAWKDHVDVLNIIHAVGPGVLGIDANLGRG